VPAGTACLGVQAVLAVLALLAVPERATAVSGGAGS
jgi:hypothetical protein